jgi:hypothetical protein
VEESTVGYETKQRKKDNFFIKAANMFRARNNKIKLKEANPEKDHVSSEGVIDWTVPAPSNQ